MRGRTTVPNIQNVVFNSWLIFSISTKKKTHFIGNDLDLNGFNFMKRSFGENFIKRIMAGSPAGKDDWFNGPHGTLSRKFVAIFVLSLLRTVEHLNGPKNVQFLFHRKYICYKRHVFFVIENFGYHGLIEIRSAAQHPLFQIFQILQILK